LHSWRALGAANMVLKIERSADGNCVVLRLAGRMQFEHLPQLRNVMKEGAELVLDLEDVKLVDRDVVRFLGACEENGTELRHCSRYIREWIAKERAAPESD